MTIWRVDRSDLMDSKSVQPGATPGLSAIMDSTYRCLISLNILVCLVEVCLALADIYIFFNTVRKYKFMVLLCEQETSL